MNKNLWLLILSQVFAFTAAPVTVFLSGIIGSQFSPVKSLATLPMALSIVGIAIFAIFAAKVMSIIGRRAGFICASIGSSLSSLLAAYSIVSESFILFNLGCFLIGAGVAFSHQYRFAAVETVDKERIVKRHLAWINALRIQLREQDKWDEVFVYLEEEDVNYLNGAKNKATQLNQKQIKELTEFYRLANQKLFTLVGREFNWRK